MIWLATANLIYPNVAPTCLASADQIEKEILRLFQATITPIQLDTHLVSWKDRNSDIEKPKRGGDRSRYLFKTEDGLTPSDNGNFRLYKSLDDKYDGVEKVGTTFPDKTKVPIQFHNLIDWYLKSYN